VSAGAPIVDRGAPVDFEVAKIVRALGTPRGGGEVEVERRGRRLTIRVARPDRRGRAPARADVAQLRAESDGRFALFWSRATGGWAAYGFTGSLDACVREVRRDAFGCFWGP
jgi:hypothetical protein